eukprot:SAG22_NODE_492_length_9824_cov_12.256864_11_plen_195_part_00
MHVLGAALRCSDWAASTARVARGTTACLRPPESTSPPSAVGKSPSTGEKLASRLDEVAQEPTPGSSPAPPKKSPKRSPEREAELHAQYGVPTPEQRKTIEASAKAKAGKAKKPKKPKKEETSYSRKLDEQVQAAKERDAKRVEGEVRFNAATVAKQEAQRDNVRSTRGQDLSPLKSGSVDLSLLKSPTGEYYSD